MSLRGLTPAWGAGRERDAADDERRAEQLRYADVLAEQERAEAEAERRDEERERGGHQFLHASNMIAPSRPSYYSQVRPSGAATA